MNYTLSDFDYDLPDNRIAQKPADPRDHARLLVYNRADRSVTDDYFYNITTHLYPGTTLTVNNSRVEKCRLLFDNERREIFILEQIDGNTVRALVRPGKKFREGTRVQLEGRISAEVLSVDKEGIRTLRLIPDLNDSVYDAFRRTPFPPYIEQNEQLSAKYQTIYARYNPERGSKAAPTAGLHFTENLVRSVRESGFAWAEVTLEVGLGTFAPVKEENIDDHPMHSERYELSDATARILNDASHITAVGTTSMRVLESIAGEANGHFSPASGETDIFIRPGYRFKAVDSLITNFHLPKSTLLMLVAAFMGFDEMHRVYRHAIENSYRFYSFGDAMLIL